MNKEQWENNNKFFQINDIVIYKKYSYKFNKYEKKFAKIIWNYTKNKPVLVLLNKNLSYSKYIVTLRDFECDGEFMRFRHLRNEEEQIIRNKK